MKHKHIVKTVYINGIPVLSDPIVSITIEFELCAVFDNHVPIKKST